MLNKLEIICNYVESKYKLIKEFSAKIKGYNLSAYASQAAFFIVMSIFPFLILLLTLIKYTPLTKEALVEFVSRIIPATFIPMTQSVINQLYSESSITLISITAIIAIWSSGKGIMGIMRGIDVINEVEKKPNYIIQRIIASIYTFLFLIAITASLGLIVFGAHIFNLIQKHAPLIYEFISIFIKRNITITFLILTLFFIATYTICPMSAMKKNTAYGNSTKKSSLMALHVLPGALFSALSWILFSFGFSLYVDHFSKLSSMYGSISTFMVLLLWLYICMYIMFIGAVINKFFENEIIGITSAITKRYRNLEDNTDN